MKKFISFFLCLIVLFNVCSFTASAAPFNYDEVPQISTKDVFEQKKNDYYVYYYMENCPFCNQVKEKMLNFAKKGKNIYFVDYGIAENRCKSYDWEAAMKKYNKLVGKSDKNGNIEFFAGESKEKYVGLKNIYGKEMRFSFDIVTEDNIYQFQGYHVGDVVANVQTPEIDYYNITSPEQMVIAGVPVLFHIVNGRITYFYFDTPEIEVFLNGLNI